MQHNLNDVREALRTFQSDRDLFAITVHALEGEYAVRIDAEGAQCRKCDRVHLSTGNIGAVGRTGRTLCTADLYSNPNYTSCFPEARAETVVPVL